MIPDLDAGGIGWRPWRHRFDIGGEILERRNKKRCAGCEPSGKNKIGQNEVKPRAGGDDQDLAPQRFMCKRPRTILRCRSLGLILAKEFYVATERNGRKEIFCFTHFSAEEFRAESKRKLEDPDADPSSGQEMPEFMECDEHTQNNQEPPRLLQ